MLTERQKQIVSKLLNGYRLRDDYEFEPGMCSNGGHYSLHYRVRGMEIQVVSSYEDDEWHEFGHGNLSHDLLDLISHVERTWSDVCRHVDGRRWSFDDFVPFYNNVVW